MMKKYKQLFVFVSIALMFMIISCAPNINQDGQTNLTSLTVSAGNLTPNFDSTILDYSITVGYPTEKINFTAETGSTQSILNYRFQVAGDSWGKWTEIVSGLPSPDLELNEGMNQLEIRVQSADETHSTTYSVLINRQAMGSQNKAELNNLKVVYTYQSTDYQLLYKPVFDPGTSDYDLFVVARNKISGMIVSFPMFSIIPYYDQGTVKIDGEEVASGEKKSFFLNSGSYEIVVTAEDGITTKTYTLQVYRETEIHEAVNNSQLTNGDIMTVVPDQYEEAEEINLPDKAIYLLSLDPQDNTIREDTIIDGCDSHRVFRAQNNNEIPTISGFTIQNGSANHGAGIYLYNASVNIMYNTITQNQASGITTSRGGGMYIYNASPNIFYNAITENKSSHGGGINIWGESSPQIEHNNIQNNHAVEAWGGGIYINSLTGTPSIKHNTISNNTAMKGGGAIYTYSCSPVIESNPNISENEAKKFGGGIYIEYGSSMVRNNVIHDNTAELNGGGIFINDASPVIEGNAIQENAALQSGGGIYIIGNVSEPNIINNVTIHDNYSANMGNDDIYIAEGNPIIDNNGGPPVIWP
jgi:parallel beta-helix repeat protein/predicted outer membrane repeat protein